MADELKRGTTMSHPPAVRLREPIERWIALHASARFYFIMRGETGDSSFSAPEIDDDIGWFQLQAIKDREICLIGQIPVMIRIRMRTGGSVQGVYIEVRLSAAIANSIKQRGCIARE